MTPRVGIALAGAGALIAIGGAIGIAGDQLTTSDGDLQRIPGVLISAALIAVGLFVLTKSSSGPFATAAATAAALGIPTLLFFVTVDDGDFPPFSFDAVLLVSTVAWLALYVVGPARGRMLLLALALVVAPIFVMEQVEEISGVPESVGEVFGQTFFGGYPDDMTYDEDGFPVIDETTTFEEPVAPEFPDPTNLGAIALAFGLVYVGAGLVLARAGFDGTGTPFSAIGGIALLIGIAFLADDLKDVGSGLALVVLGLLVLVVGAVAARRFTTWFGGFLVGVGVLVLVAEALGDDSSGLTSSIVFLLVGLAVVFAAHLVAAVLGEPAEEDQRRSFRDWTRRGPGVSPTPDDVFAP